MVIEELHARPFSLIPIFEEIFVEEVVLDIQVVESSILDGNVKDEK